MGSSGGIDAVFVDGYRDSGHIDVPDEPHAERPTGNAQREWRKDVFQGILVTHDGQLSRISTGHMVNPPLTESACPVM